MEPPLLISVLRIRVFIPLVRSRDLTSYGLICVSVCLTKNRDEKMIPVCKKSLITAICGILTSITGAAAISVGKIGDLPTDTQKEIAMAVNNSYGVNPPEDILAKCASPEDVASSVYGEFTDNTTLVKQLVCNEIDNSHPERDLCTCSLNTKLAKYFASKELNADTITHELYVGLDVKIPSSAIRKCETISDIVHLVNKAVFIS